MRRLLTIALLAIGIVAAAAQNIAELPCQALASLRYHLCLKAPRNGSVTATMLWNYADSADYRYMTYTIPAVVGQDDYNGLDISYITGVRTAEADSITAQGTLNVAAYAGGEACLSAILAVNPDGASVEIGTAKDRRVVAIAYDRFCPGSIGYSAAKPLKEIRNELIYTAMPAKQFAEYSSIDELTQHIRTSGNLCEGLWQILDRDTDPALSTLGGDYHLATVANRLGGYDIVYLGGATHGTDIWAPLQIKGRLMPTQFADNYDLEWLTAAHMPAGEGTYAAYTLGHEILELHFPLHKATLRLRRSH